MSDSERRPNSVDVLLQEYSLLKSEINLIYQTYERQITYSQLIMAALAGTFIYLFNHQTAAMLADAGLPPKLTFVLGALLITALTFLLVFKVLESDFRMQVTATRMAMIEEMINERINDQVLHWESFLCAEFIKTEGASVYRNPSLVVAGIYLILVFGGAVVLPIHLYWYAWFAVEGRNDLLIGLLVALGIISTVYLSLQAVFTGLKIHGDLRSQLKAAMKRIVAAQRPSAASK